ncbi:hypothetical protein BGW36DRAFT_451378 [Talaromyces proteolyticus]|uniref:UDP-N-acetylglucosamine 2-epimerase domain-containing protein n=1 Tax=Talaromyces proteolyticus TaxID=1131652 RepID=A0AAD4KPK6_9EURO|nr:uncharacterized protein BGW36DRAFT_451378 [Talaromyces proteolyticus]KAH8696213.1 hypothetical protein BGW36DRAFT_451378 [Talaromyces proteolyticus]
MLVPKEAIIENWSRPSGKSGGEENVDLNVDNRSYSDESEGQKEREVSEDRTWVLQAGAGRVGRRKSIYKKGKRGGSLLLIKHKNGQVKISGQRVKLGDVRHHVHANTADTADVNAVADVVLTQESDKDILIEKLSPITKKRRRIAFSSNTRADWVKLHPLADILVDNGFDVDIFITGMHMVKEYGSTYEEIVKNRKFGVFTRQTWAPGDSEIENATATMGATFQLLQQFDYDLLIVHGDRLEAKAAADAAHLSRCRLGHVEGGELTGGDDNKNRYAITAIADYHFPSSQDAADRLIASGQRIGTIFPIGSPDLDVFLRPSAISIDDVLRKYSIPFKEFGIAPFHTNSAESESSGEQAKNFYGALLDSGRNFVIPRPNNDKGTEKVQEVLDALPKNRVCVAPNFEFNDYIVLLKEAGCVAGNSSVVVTSAPALGKLCLNIGSRQQGRAPPTDGLFNFSPNDREGILGCLAENWGGKYSRNVHYGDGRAAERFFEALNSEEFWKVSQQKLLFDQKAS